MAELKTFLIAMSPVVELRGAIPIALELYKLPLWSAYLFSVLGNIAALSLVLAFSPLLNRYVGFLFSRIRKTKQSAAEKLGKDLAVVILVATPIPFVGGWTGALVAFAFGIPFRRSVVLAALGSFLAGIVVSIVTLGIRQIL